jgi:hypothetical protein
LASHISIPVRSRRAHRGQFLQKLQHAVPSIVVFSDGLSHLSHEPHGLNLWLGIAEVGVSVLVIGSVIRGFRKLRAELAANTQTEHHPHHGVDWIDICLGAMLSVEAYAKFHATAHIPRPTILLAVTMFTVGLLHGRIAAWGDRRRQLRVDADGITVPGGPFRRLTLTWPEVASIEVDDRSALVTAIDGRKQRLNLTDAINAAAVREALAAARVQLDEARHAADASIESTTADA